ncbi:hypothetical protein EVAR_31589_1 [Eumeta japonica]|uniref:Uncharacterized protein n=1 Tax=Eumeta variegata TaxID=151549 RepID=A0A4C1V7Q0_EUMVA|nr:hypothetical protein EVAR_31589_1 [Eumeta japonica]
MLNDVTVLRVLFAEIVALMKKLILYKRALRIRFAPRSFKTKFFILFKQKTSEGRIASHKGGDELYKSLTFASFQGHIMYLLSTLRQIGNNRQYLPLKGFRSARAPGVGRDYTRVLI